MQNKKLTKILALSLLGLIGLTACDDDDIVAKPSNYDDPIVTIGNEEIFNNTMNIVLDGIRDGALASDVLDEVLYQYSVSVLGDYDTLKKVAAGEGVDEFVKSHKAYWDEDRAEGAAASEQEKARVKAKWDTIEERIAIKMYNQISSGSYSERNIFDEKAFLYSLRSSMKSVSDPKSVTDFYEGLILPEVEDYEVFAEGLLHREYYQSEANTYVADELIPDIYRQLLVEQYLLDESYNTLGRSYARKVHVVAIANNADYPKAAPYLMEHFVKEYISKGLIPTTDESALDSFKWLDNLWKGIDLTTDDALFLEAAGLEPMAGEVNVFKGTKYADLKEDYAKITDSKDDKEYDESIENDFTGSNTYTKEIGLEIKTNNIKLEDSTTTGWFVKNGGLSSLPSTITNRLFNISVANAVNDKDAKDRWDAATSTYAVPEDESNYVAKINGKCYLKVASTQQGADAEDDILFYDDSSSTYYIVQIEEAVSSSRLAKKSDQNYSNIRDAATMEEIINEVVKVVADSDSYKTLSNKYWLEKAGLEYHDTVVYDYFKSNFPELFDDEDDD